MSVWDRLRGWLAGDGGEDGGDPEPHSGDAAWDRDPGGRAAAPQPPSGAEVELAAMAEQADAAGPSAGDAARAAGLLEALADQGRELRGLELARRVLRTQPDAERLAFAVAERLAARSDLDAAAHALEALTERADASAAALMLAGEIAERGGRQDDALACYERVMARDLDHPGAAERAHRLREAGDPGAELAGATLLADGALARGRYRIERELGRGGAGVVFLARDLALERVVGLKVYHRRGRADRQRLQSEARTAARIEHPGVVRIFDVDERLGAIVMEQVPGGAVRDMLRRGEVPLDRGRRWLATALEALAFVHARGWAHRDLKPSNLLLRPDDRAVLTDFGLATRIGEAPPLRGGAGEGTLAYMPPEQRAGAPADPAADVHAFGATMREVLGQARPDPPQRLLELAAACTAKDPKERPPVAELVVDFDTA